MKNRQELLLVKDQLKQPKNIKLEENEAPQRKDVKNKCGHWRTREHVKYLAFLRKYYYIMRDSGLRYHYRIFNKMAEEIGTRSSSQCKSHHQKMLHKYNNSLESIAFETEMPDEIITIGEGQTHLNNKEVVKQGIKHYQMGQKPFVIVRVDGGLMLIINEKLIAEY